MKIQLSLIIVCLPCLLFAQGTWSGTQTNDNVAIGTYVYPTIKLHVNGLTKIINQGDRNLMLENDDSDSWVTFHDPGQYLYSMGIDRSDGGKFKLNTGSQVGENNHFSMDSNGNIGIGTSSPQAVLDIGKNIGGGATGAIFGRLPEGNGIGNGTFLGVRGYETQPVRVKSFAIEHSFYGLVNSSINFHRGDGTAGGYLTFNTDQNTEQMRISKDGNVGIGTTNPGSFKLAVNGKIWSQEVNVAMTNPGPDYVFEKGYDLLSLSELETYINQNKHLPEVPSAKEMEAEGLNLKEMNLLLLKKVEELTLYLIMQNNTNAQLKLKVESFQNDLKELQSKNR
jgi:hypothetical protein